MVVGGKHWNFKFGGVTTLLHLKIFQLEISDLYTDIYGRIRQWKILALSVMHDKAPVDVGRYVQTGWSMQFHVFFSPQALLVIFFEGGGAKPWYFTALEASPPSNSIAAVGFRFWVSSKARGRSGAGVRRGDARFAFWSMCIQLTYLG